MDHYTAPVVRQPEAEEVETLTMGVFTVVNGSMVAADPAVVSWMETMRS